MICDVDCEFMCLEEKIEGEKGRKRNETAEYYWVNRMSVLISYVGIYINNIFVNRTYGIPKVWMYNTLIT